MTRNLLLSSITGQYPSETSVNRIVPDVEYVNDGALSAFKAFALDAARIAHLRNP